MPLTRTIYWDTREYHDFLLAQAKAPFEWGVNDCCMFPANGIQAFTGIDIAADFRGKYTNQASAIAAIKSVAGGASVADAAAWCAAKHGLVEYPKPLYAQRGDLVVMANPAQGAFDQDIAGLVHLSGSKLVTVGEGGLVVMDIRFVKRAWRV
jgi:hypothetical protein